MEKLERLRELSREELEEKIAGHKEEVFNLRLSRNTKELDNPIRLRSLRRELARIKTILSEDLQGIRKLAEAPSLPEKKSEKKTDKKS